jgi:hypothetical protein
MKSILAATVIMLGLSMNSADARHVNQAQLYATMVHHEAHRLDDGIRRSFPRYPMVLRKSQQLAELAHSTERLVARRANLDQAEFNIRAMQGTLRALQADLQAIVDRHPFRHGQAAMHLLRHTNQLDSSLRILRHEVRELNRYVILPHPLPGHGHPRGHFPPVGRRPIGVLQPAGVHVRNGGLLLNVPF